MAVRSAALAQGLAAVVDDGVEVAVAAGVAEADEHGRPSMEGS